MIQGSSMLLLISSNLGHTAGFWLREAGVGVIQGRELCGASFFRKLKTLDRPALESPSVVPIRKNSPLAFE
ncbi:hypothetical protein BKA61DRAFT_589565 [Leptodontidium sp. MPI-SDFR-AT-0119]|nr:hypothetical protein BKA61DRAFT_589565 [Leptodontidium sp. MPI-SDFR-AT-0119]